MKMRMMDKLSVSWINNNSFCMIDDDHNDINFSCTPCEEDQVLCRPRPGCSCMDSNQDGFFVEETGAMAQNEGFYSISLLFSWGKRGSENPGMTSEFGWGYFWKERFLIPMAIRWASPSAVAFWFTANLPEEVGVRRWVWKLHIRSSCRWWRWPRLRYGAEKMETCKGLNLRSNNLGSNFCKCQLRIGSGKRICVGVSSCWGLISDIVRGIWTSSFALTFGNGGMLRWHFSSFGTNGCGMLQSGPDCPMARPVPSLWPATAHRPALRRDQGRQITWKILEVDSHSQKVTVSCRVSQVNHMMVASHPDFWLVWLI